MIQWHNTKGSKERAAHPRQTDTIGRPQIMTVWPLTSHVCDPLSRCRQNPERASNCGGHALEDNDTIELKNSGAAKNYR